MKHRIWAYVVSLIGLQAISATAAERIVGISPSDGTTLFVKQFSVPAGTTIEGLEFRSNDARTVFSDVFLAHGVGASLQEGTVVASAENIGAPTAGVVRVHWRQPVTVSAPTDYWAAVRVPASPGHPTPGTGAALGAFDTATPGSSYVAGGTTGELTMIGVDLSIVLITGVAGKAAPTENGPAADPIARTFLAGGTPNPAAAIVNVRFGIDRSTVVTLEVYNVAGHRVRTLLAGRREPGTYVQSWDGRDEKGHVVAAGVYLTKLRAGDKLLTQKIVLAR